MDNSKKKLGLTELLVSPIAFGGNVFGWTLDESASFEMLDALLDRDVNFIDTADTYSTWAPGNVGGESEIVIGKWLKKSGKRDKVVIATKLGGDMGNGRKGLSATYIKQAVDASLKRLQTDYIDLYQSHYDDPETEISETITAFNDLIRSGKIRHIGASNLSAERIRESNEFAREHGLAGYVSLQPLYNLYDRDPFETEYASLSSEENLAVLPYYALASGFLTGKYRQEADKNKSPRGGGMQNYMNDRGFRILEAMDRVAADLGASPAQVAIAWLLNKPLVTAPIASTTTLTQLDDLVKGSTLKLSADQMAALDAASNATNS